jgi:hypothetical protein
MTDLTADVEGRSSTEGCLWCWKSDTINRAQRALRQRPRLKMTTLDVFNIHR